MRAKGGACENRQLIWLSLLANPPFTRRFYHDPMSTPHQRLVLRPAETMHRCRRDSVDDDGMDDGEGANEPVEVAGGHWFATYTTL